MLSFRGPRPRPRPHASIRIIITLALCAVVAAQMLPVGVSAPATPLTQQAAMKPDLPPQAKGAPQASNTSPAAPPAPPAIEGWVKSKGSGLAVHAALITLDGQATALADAAGYFRFEREQIASLPGISSTNVNVDVRVSAEGYAAWTLSGAKYYSGDTLRVYPRLASSADAPTLLHASKARNYPRAALASNAGNFIIGPQYSALGTQNAAPPASIRVYRTQSDVVEVVPFRDYVKHSLPSEWIPSWSPEALKAGAMAVKTYAWYWVSRGGKQVALGADVKDNVEDQVYDPNVSYASTDAAVDATFNYSMLRNGAIFQAQYCAGSYGADPTDNCPWPGQYMTQWGSAYWADQGRTWGWILGFYYPGVVINPTPPGGGFTGTPVPRSTEQDAIATRPPVPATPVSTPYVVGQGSNYQEVFQEAYERNGGQAVLGNPTGPVRWWMQYLSEYNVLSQPFKVAGSDAWLVLDVLTSEAGGGMRAFLLSGDIAAAYRAHNPPGPEWVGAPSSDPYKGSATLGGLPGQSFVKGSLTWNGDSATFTPWPDKFPDWKAEYFVGFKPTLPGTAPDKDLAGRPVSVANAQTPNLHWSAEQNVPPSLGVGQGEWSAQLTKDISTAGGTYDFTLTANSGARLWIDDLLAINGWNWGTGGGALYNADLSAGTHRVRVQYYNLGGRETKLDLNFAPRAATTPTPVAVQPLSPSGGIGGQRLAALRLRMTWLGRQPELGGWAQPVTLYLSDPNTARVLLTRAGEADKNGVAFFGDLPSGSYNVHIKGNRTLQTARAYISLVDKTVVDLDMKAQVPGDLDGDNCVTVDDFRIVQAMLGAGNATPGFNPQADLNGDGVVTMSDISLLRAGFDRCGDISADNAFGIMSADAAPNLSTSLLPWTQPERLDHNLSLEATAARTQMKPGEIIEVQVVANTGAQPIDGVSFVVTYDPRRLRPVDASGNQATGSEPGAALPAVMGNWLDAKGGRAGYAAGFLQGNAPSGLFTIATLRLQALPGASGPTRIAFVPLTSPNMQITNGGANLLARATGLDLHVTP